ncbi:tetratricopeptide repeat protein [uncultured Tenacibaculum sp.]|uniref:tetratricopeptide repeat protein n=1 Tax=uncultured Tenacibaculum sp. TaxID=174713 RepID=UPI001044F410|nr:tetratricopeptide repeat protein [uncultured Tenacibaculum sp.]TCI91783.1 tetratricopeptide repeat protein [Tenacibaculum sp. M341]
MKVKKTNLTIAICYFLFNILVLSSQNKRKIDSLKSVINNQKTSDSTLIVAYNEIGIQYASFNYKLSKSYINKALTIAGKSNNKRGMAGAYNCLGILHYYQKKYDSALVNFDKALTINKNENHLWGQASALYQIGVIQKYQVNYLEAISNFQKAKSIFELKKDSISLAKSIENIGASYNSMGYYQKSMSFYLEANEIYEKQQNTVGIGRIYHHIARIYIKQKAYKKALEYSNKALKGIKKTNNVKQITTIYLGIGKCYLGLKQYEKALLFFKKALDARILFKNKSNIAITQVRMGEVYYYLEDYKKSIEYLKKALENLTLKGDYFDRITANNLIAKSYLEVNKLSLAYKYVCNAVKLSEEIGSLEKQRVSYIQFVNILKKQSRFNKALEYAEKVNVLNDSIYKMSELKKVKELQVIYELEKKEKQIDQQENEISFFKKERKIRELRMNFLIITIVLFLVFLLLGFYIHRQKILKSKLEIENSLLEKQKLSAEIAFKKRELVTHTLQITKKNMVLEKLKKHIENEIKTDGGNVEYKYNVLLQIIKNELMHDKEQWSHFKNYFEKVHPNFYVVIKEKYPKITPGELRLMALIKMNLSYKEIGGVLNVTYEGVKKATYRLRKKMEITSETSLQDVVNSL